MKTNCFLCQEDITDKTKVLSYFNFPHQAWDNAQSNWVANFRQLFNQALCSACAKKDLDAAHSKMVHNARVTEITKEMEGRIDEAKKEVSAFKHLFGNLYIKL